MSELLPAILAQDEKTFRERLAVVEGHTAVVHLDVMDGAFVPNRTWFDPSVLNALKTPVHFELHLMVTDPSAIIEQVQRINSVVRVMWHIEAFTNHMNLIERVHGLHKEVGLAIAPKTPVDTLARHALSLDEILILGGQPGFSGQHLESPTLDRAWEIHGRWPEVTLGFDIGVNADTIPKLKAAGISRFCAASAIFDAKDPVGEIQRLIALL